MKKNLILITIIAVMFISKSFAQQCGWIDISNNLSSSGGTITLPDMHWISDNEGWICSGFLGEIYHTTDGGQTFAIQTTQYSTNAIYMLDSLVGYAGGAQGRVYKTIDGGANWITHGSIGGPLRDIDFPPNSDSGYCSGDNGKIYKITSSGVSSMYTGLNSHLKSISFPSTSQGWACGQSVIVHYNGSSWTTDQAYPSATYIAICMVNETTGWTVGDKGIIIKTTNAGNLWEQQVNPDTNIGNSLYDVHFLNLNDGWAVSSDGSILHTTNGGNLWAIEAEGLTNEFLTSVYFSSPTNGYVLGNNGTLLKYTQPLDQ